MSSVTLTSTQLYSENTKANAVQHQHSGSLFGSPVTALAFMVSQFIFFLGYILMETATDTFASDILLLLTAIVAIFMLFIMIPFAQAILKRHHSHYWANAWRQIIEFIIFTVVFFAVTYGLQMLRTLWISGTATALQSAIVTVLMIFGVVAFVSTVREQINEIDQRTGLVVNNTFILLSKRTRSVRP